MKPAEQLEHLAPLEALLVEIINLVFDGLPAVSLARMLQSCKRWCAFVATAAERRLLMWGPRFAAHVECRICNTKQHASADGAPNAGWLRALGAIEEMQSAVGPRPGLEAWRAELAGIKDAGPIMRTTCKFPWALELREEGWPPEHADAVTHVYTWANKAMGAGVLNSRSDFRACTWLVCEALLQAAARQPSTRQPPCYANLYGRGGLATDDPSWEGLARPQTISRQTCASGVEPIRFKTSAIALALADGASSGVVWSGTPRAGAGSRGVVCFRPPAVKPGQVPHRIEGGRMQSLVAVGSSRYALPPFARVTLESVAEPGEWTLGDQGGATQCRLYTVNIEW